MKVLIALAALTLIAACAVTPKALEAGPYESEAGFTVDLDAAWSQWANQINPQTPGEVLSKDGLLLNRLHFMSLKDGKPMVKAASKTDLPKYSANALELEQVDFVTSSLLRIGYTAMDADNVRPVDIDGQEGLAFDLVGKWENGLNVLGLVTMVKHDDQLKLALFLAPEQHYFANEAPEVRNIFASIDLPN